MHLPERDLQRLREFRAFRPKDLSIAQVISATADHAARTHKKLGELVAIWEELVPEQLASHTALSGLRGGVLHVIVDSSSAAFELDRLLRSGLTDQLRQRFRGTLIRVKTRIGKLE